MATAQLDATKRQKIKPVSEEPEEHQRAVSDVVRALKLDKCKADFAKAKNKGLLLQGANALLKPIMRDVDLKAGLLEDLRGRKKETEAKEAGYYSQPSLALRGTLANADTGAPVVSTTASLTRALTEIVGYAPTLLDEVTEQALASGELSIHEIAAILMWEQVSSTLDRELEAGARERFLRMMPADDWRQQQFRSVSAVDIGHNIHGIRAKDSTAHWAYYHVYVPPSREEAFIDAINSGANLNLEDYGRVIASTYEHVYRQKLEDEANRKFQALLDQYHRFTEDHLQKSTTRQLGAGGIMLGATAVGLTSLPLLFSAGLLAGAGLAGIKSSKQPGDSGAQKRAPKQATKRLIEELHRLQRQREAVHDSVDQSQRDNVHNISDHFTLSEGAAKIAAVLIEFYGLTLAEFNEHIIEPLREYSPETWYENARHLRELSCLFSANDLQSGWEAVGMELFVNPTIGNVDALQAYLAGDDPAVLTSKSYRVWDHRWSALLFAQLVLALAANKPELEPAAQDWMGAICHPDPLGADNDLWRGLHAQFEVHLNAPLPEYVEDYAKRTTYEIQAKCREMYFNLMYTYSNIDCEYVALNAWVDVYGAKLIGEIAKLRGFIASETNSREFVRNLLRRSLQGVFEKLETPEGAQETLLDELADRLLSNDPTAARSSSSWAERVGRGEVSEVGAVVLPETAPAIWKQDKQKGDTPPDFIKRHYGPEGLDVLRADGTGLKRNDLKAMDSTLYTALANWLKLKKNALPDDCPLPTKSEAISMRAASLTSDDIKAAKAVSARRV